VAVTDPGALPAAELQRCIRHSYDLVVAKLPKKVQVALTGALRSRVSERLGHRAPRL